MYNAAQIREITGVGIMDETIKEIAVLLRATDQMAALFVERVQARMREPVSEAEVLTAMKKVPVKSLTMDKVIDRIQKQQNMPSRRRRTPSASAAKSVKTESSGTQDSPSANARREPRTALQQLSFVLIENWNRAEAEGLDPERMTTEAFVNAIYQFTDRREGTRQRILKAAQTLDDDDVMLTPALVADVVHQLYES
jgi:hypothetical protein